MTSTIKSKRYRKRYIVFEVTTTPKNEPISRSELIGAIKYHFNIFNKKAIDIAEESANPSKVPINENKPTPDNFKTQPWLILFENNFGLIKCAHTDKGRTIELLTSITQLKRWRTGTENSDSKASDPRTANKKYPGNFIKIEIKTLGTSGTIKSARKKYFNKLTGK